ncbi:MAG TPA: SGNH/GDSL hydrolase family protein [Fimbriimonadaceae bacterium]
MSFHLQSNDRVVFFGDSITEQQLYTLYVEAFVRTRFPKLEVTFFNRGWGGDTCGGSLDLGGLIEERATRDVAQLNPTVVTVMLGMNDGGYTPYLQETEAQFAAEYERMLKNVLRAAPNAKFTLMRTSPWDQYTCDPCGQYPEAPFPPKGYNDALLEYGKVVEKAAEFYKLNYVDFNLPMVEVMKRGAVRDVALARQIVPDWIHPGPSGHLIMAGELLKSWDATDLVSSVKLNALTAEVVDTMGASVPDFDGLTWSQLDEALPFCASDIDPATDFVLEIYDFQDTLNRQELEVMNLPSGMYELLIDEDRVGLFSSEKLARGINLADYKTPMRRQALEVLVLAAKRSMLQMTRWRQVDVKFALVGPALEASKNLEKMEEDVLREEIAKAQPVTHRFELRKV